MIDLTLVVDKGYYGYQPSGSIITGNGLVDSEILGLGAMAPGSGHGELVAFMVYGQICPGLLEWFPLCDSIQNTVVKYIIRDIES